MKFEELIAESGIFKKDVIYFAYRLKMQYFKSFAMVYLLKANSGLYAASLKMEEQRS